MDFKVDLSIVDKFGTTISGKSYLENSNRDDITDIEMLVTQIVNAMLSLGYDIEFIKEEFAFYFNFNYDVEE